MIYLSFFMHLIASSSSINTDNLLYYSIPLRQSYCFGLPPPSLNLYQSINQSICFISNSTGYTNYQIAPSSFRSIGKRWQLDVSFELVLMLMENRRFLTQNSLLFLLDVLQAR